MKTRLTFAILLSLLFFACNNKKGTDTAKTEEPSAPKILIAYYSLSGNTKAVAEQIHDKFGGDMFEMQLVNPYINDEKAVIEIVKEEKERDYLPELSNKVENMADYDIVFLGTPIWYGTASSPVFSFVKSYDFSGKTIIPFYTCGGGDDGTYVEDMKAICTGAEFLESFGNGRPEREAGTHIEKIEKHLEILKQTNFGTIKSPQP